MGSGSHVILGESTFPVDAPIAVKTTHKIPQELWTEIVGLSKVKTYRQIAEEYGVSHESVRRVLNVAFSK